MPMFLLHRKDVEPDGDRPALLCGYGGFDSNLTPGFSETAALWAERGGISAVATLRGGGEFGEEWHEAGMRENKQNVFNDFLSAAEWLFETGWTRPETLAISGGSNGGFLSCPLDGGRVSVKGHREGHLHLRVQGAAPRRRGLT